MKTIFITGASTGLGNAAAKLFAERGWKVIATMRHPENEKELNLIHNVTLMPLDVTDAAQVEAAVGKSTEAGVDVVFNNAGYGLGGPLESYTSEQITRQIDTNLTAVIRVTQAFIPYFRAKQQGLFITTTSIGGLITFPFYSVYSAAKWGVEGFCESLSFELSPFGIGVKTVAPGGIRSSFRNSSDRSQHDAYNGLFTKVTQAFMEGKTPTTVTEPAVIAEIVFEAATDGKDQLRYAAGQDAIQYLNERAAKGPEIFRRDMRKLFFGE
jgi:NAD(P)-dependent dehydrogenase (short-subunit alcohol dehydrogenase family)